VLQLAFKPRTKLSAEGAVTIATLQRVALCLWRCCVTEGVRAAVLEAKSYTSTVYSAAAATASSTALSATAPTAAVADSNTGSTSTSSSSGNGTQLTVVTSAQPPPALHSSSGNSGGSSKHTSALRTGVLDPLCALLTLAKAALAQADWRALELLLGEAKALFHTSPAASAAAMAWLAGGFAGSAGAATDADDFSDDETDDEEHDHVASDVSHTVSPDTATAVAAAAAAVGASPSSRKAAGSSSSGGSSSAKKAAKAQAAGASAHARSASTAAHTSSGSHATAAAAASSLWRVLEWAYVPPSPAKDPHFYERMADEISRDMQGVTTAGSTAGATAAAAAAVAAMRAVAQALSTSLWHAADTDAGGALFLPPRAVTDSELAGLWLLQEAFQTAGGVSLAGHTFAALCTDLAAAAAGALDRALLLAPLLCRLLCCDGSRRCAHWQVHSVAAALSRYEAVAVALRSTLTAVHSSSSSSDASAAATLLTTFTQALVAAALEESEGVIAAAWRDAELHAEAAKLQHAVTSTAAAATADTVSHDAPELPSFGTMEGLVVHNNSSRSSSDGSKPWVWGRRCALRCPAALFALIDILVPWSTSADHTTGSSSSGGITTAAVSALRFAVGCVLPALTFGCPISLESLVNVGAVRRLLELIASNHTTADTAVADDAQLEQVRHLLKHHFRELRATSSIVYIEPREYTRSFKLT
jgi:trimeric autotransporter adhesin